LQTGGEVAERSQQMKILAAFCLSILALTPLAMAKLSMTPQSLGQVEGTLHFCSGVNPKADAKYKEFGKRLVADASAEELNKVRNSSEYKEAYDSITEQLGKASPKAAVEACTAFLGKQ
jgi:hypothetical protein